MEPERASAALVLIASLIGLVGAVDNTMGTGSILSATGNSTWLSSSGKFAFGFYNEGSGFAVGIKFFPMPNSNYSTVIWTADRDHQPIPANANLTFGYEGLVLHLDEGNRIITGDSYDGSSQLAFASMKNSGNFIVYDSHYNIAWQTFDNPTDTLLAGQAFPMGHNLISSVSENNQSSGRFRFSMQRDGNVVLYPVNTPDTETNAYWSSGTSGYNGLVLDHDGSFRLTDLNFIGHPFFLSLNSSPDMSVEFLRIEANGYLRIYSTNQSGLMMVSGQIPDDNNKCFIKGICGLNSYCNSTGDNGDVQCLCLPGYVYIDRSRVFVGCERNFTRWSCEAAVNGSTGNSACYNISRLHNITWSDDSYNRSTVKSEHECSDVCFRDCDCYAALFLPSTNQCNKQRYPFQYGRVLLDQDEPTVAFIKVGLAEQENQPSVKPVSRENLRVLGTVPLVLPLLLTATFAIVLDFLIFFLCRYRMGIYRRLCESMETGLAKAMAPRSFSYKQLKDATDGYKEEIGEGRYGKVFRRLLPLRDAGTPIAVKKLKNVRGKVEEKFRNELKSIGRVHNRNLVRLLGFCHEGSDWILVYEYMSRGSLADLIFQSHEAPPSWKQRVSISMDVARGLYYLHEGCDVAIIHGDIKPENILIGDDGIAKIGDLGLAKHLQPGNQITYTRPRGTPGYKAPEWANDWVSPKVDVVSFGILLLELLCLKKFWHLQELDGEFNLASWAYKYLKGKTKWQVPGGDVDIEELKEMMKVALWCLHGSPEKRPSMYDVVMMLCRKKIVEFPPVPLLDWNDRADTGQPPMADVERG
ncbi:G-type lectin S-receptor-like serine/threonine-protein kinase LECRK4 [Dendrobium catenatum]|uniref:G-type lectin S-receptor-like serine/threonine-protein kinase LECRK4 n=1 Tax=Dendrobium catenatum TaxID=906689 RepID=UPI0009F6832F|nr:G-type lectin S-receptor-like serine/threonine-protein kinase LECRK4 [Dendrobium catenatum]